MFESLLNAIPHHMDFDGQRRAERYFQIIIVIFAVSLTCISASANTRPEQVSGLAWGYAVQQFSLTVYTLGAGFVLASLLTLPPWPMYRRKPLQWQKARADKETKPKAKKAK